MEFGVEKGNGGAWGGSLVSQKLWEDYLVSNRKVCDKLTELRDVPRTSAEAEFFRSASGNYYHEDRTHLGLAKDTPAGRSIAIRSPVAGNIQSFPRLGGLHHRYTVTA